MAQNIFKLVLTDEAQNFIESLPEAVSYKIYYNILTQEQLGERIGVKRAQISRLERGYSITIPTMRRVFKALGVVTATIDLGIAGKVALW